MRNDEPVDKLNACAMATRARTHKLGGIVRLIGAFKGCRPLRPHRGDHDRLRKFLRNAMPNDLADQEREVLAGF